MTSWLPSLFQVETVLIAKFCGSRSRSDSTAASSILPTGMMSTWMSPDNPINQNPILVSIYQEIRVCVFPCASGDKKGGQTCSLDALLDVEMILDPTPHVCPKVSISSGCSSSIFGTYFLDLLVSCVPKSAFHQVWLTGRQIWCATD